MDDEGGDPMKIELGEHVHSSNGHDIGTIKHLILDPANCQIKTLVVEKGWLLPDDIEIPLEVVQVDEDTGLRVRYTAEQVKSLPRFDESQYRTVPRDDTALLPPYPLGAFLW